MKTTTISAKTVLLPHLCEAQSVLGLVVAGELLAMALVVANNQWPNFSWSQLGVTSLVVQWIVLSSAAALCLLRHGFSQFSPLVGGGLAYSVVLAIAAIILTAGQWLFWPAFDIKSWSQHMALSAIFSGIMLRYLYLQQQLRNQQQAELESRIQALQARIRPHFLFNSMNTIASLVSIDPDAAERVVEDLSELFRASLQVAGLVPLEEELSLCRSYVDIEQVRLGDRLGVDWQCDDCPSHVKIPRLSLQPLIENAIYHGIQGLRTGGVVEVFVRHSETDLFIQVRNPFPTRYTYDKTDQGHQIAMTNINYRLQAYYGQKASLLVQIQPGDEMQDYYVVTIRLPVAAVHEHIPGDEPDNMG